MPLKILELFAGTCSFSNEAKKRGHAVYTSDYDPQFGTDYTVDVMDFTPGHLPFKPNIVWASPPCETFSVASIGHHWNMDRTPKTDAAIEGQNRVIRTLEIIDQLRPAVFIIENPRGMLRKMPFMQNFYRYTVTYCQYGDTRQKPTDLWSNRPDLVFRPMCKPGGGCHIAAPRGSRTGTQGLKTYVDRSRIPHELCVDIVKQLESIVQ